VSMIDSTGLCLFTTAGWGPEDFVAQLDAALPGEWTLERCVESGERTWTLERMFNQGAGQTGADDTLPKRMLEEPAPSGNAEGKVNELSVMLPEYYKLRGWTEDGKPSNETPSRRERPVFFSDMGRLKP
jgi:aldehyde:ferredoxin oxidoreductase